jgi:hypothetical protein
VKWRAGAGRGLRVEQRAELAELRTVLVEDVVVLGGVGVKLLRSPERPIWYTTLRGAKTIFFCIGAGTRCVYGDLAIFGESKARAEETQGVQKSSPARSAPTR